MTNETLAKSYLTKSQVRLKVLSVLFEEGAYSDVVREAQECVELSLKAVLRFIGVEPPKQHDVGYLLIEYRDKLPTEVAEIAEELAAISKWLRKEREFAFYGDIDFIPTAEYSTGDAAKAIADCRKVVQAAEKVILG